MSPKFFIKSIFFVLVLVMGIRATRTLQAQVRFLRFQTELQDRPLGLDLAHPRFSWQWTDPRRGAEQTAFRIWVATDSLALVHGKADSWNPGKVISDSSIWIAYAGKPLKPMTRYFWKLRFWDQNGQPWGPGPIHSFETGLMGAKGWKASWISGTLPQSSNSADKPCPLLRKGFIVSKPIRSARIYATALGSYYLYLNGHHVGHQILAPGWTDYRKSLEYQTYDVSSYLKTGKNALGALLGKGWYGSGLGWNQSVYNFGPPPVRLLVQLHIRYRDGSSQWILSDSSWRTAPSPVEESTIYNGETYDARKQIKGWDLPGFADRSWARVHTPGAPDLLILSQYAEPIRITRLLHSISIKARGRGTYILDLGQNMVGWARIRVHGKAGDTIRLRFAEVLKPNGDISTLNLRTAKATDYYILKGSGLEQWEPHFTYHGFRYIEVSGLSFVPDSHTVTACVFHSDAPQSGTFLSSSPLVNKLWKNITWGQRGNMESIPTDCPQRDERLGWMGDAQAFWRAASFNRNMYRFTVQFTRVIREAQGEDGFYSDVSPRVIDPRDGAPGWADAGIIIPWTGYKQYGDLRLIRENWSAMNHYMEAIRKANPAHIWERELHNDFGDWLPAGQTTPNSTTPGDYIGTCYWAYDARLMSQMAGAIGDSSASRHYRNLHERIREAFVRHFLHGDSLGNNSQTSQVLAIQAQLLNSSQTRLAMKILSRSIRKHRIHLTTGFLGTTYILPVLSRQRNNKLAYGLLLADTYPSWGYMIREGATTMWERWNGNTGDPSMNSYNHYAFGAVADWLYRFVGGIGSQGAGFKTVRLQPHPGPGLDYASATYKGPYGTIKSSWYRQGRQIRYRFSIPPNSRACWYLPQNKVQNISSGGIPLSRLSWLHPHWAPEGKWVLDLPAGSYEFTISP